MVKRALKLALCSGERELCVENATRVKEEVMPRVHRAKSRRVHPTQVCSNGIRTNSHVNFFMPTIRALYLTVVFLSFYYDMYRQVARSCVTCSRYKRQAVPSSYR